MLGLGLDLIIIRYIILLLFLGNCFFLSIVGFFIWISFFSLLTVTEFVNLLIIWVFIYNGFSAAFSKLKLQGLGSGPCKLIISVCC